MLVLRRKSLLPLVGNEREDCGGGWVVVRRHRESRKQNKEVSLNSPGAWSHPGEGLKKNESPLGRAGPRPQNGATFSTFSTVSCPGASSLAGAVGPHATADESKGIVELHEVNESELSKSARIAVAAATAGASAEIIGLLEVHESEFSMVARTAGAAATTLVGMGTKLCDGMKDALATNKRDLDDGMERVRSALGVRRDSGGARTACETAGESEGNIGLLKAIESDFSALLNSVHSSNSCPGSLSSACARRVACSAPASARVCLGSSSLVVSAAVAHAHTSILHDACSNSWSDTGRVKGPTGRRCTKGGVSGPAEDMLPVSELEAGVNFRPAGGVRGQVAGSLPRRQPSTGTRRVREGAVAPSLHPEFPGTQFASPGRGLGIRQSMGWTKVCSTARSGIWVLKGNARAQYAS